MLELMFLVSLLLCPGSKQRITAVLLCRTEDKCKNNLQQLSFSKPRRWGEEVSWEVAMRQLQAAGTGLLWLWSQSQNESILWVNITAFPAAAYCSWWIPYYSPDKLLGQELTSPDSCQQSYHLSCSVSSCNQGIRFFAQVWRRLSAIQVWPVRSNRATLV